MQRPVRGKSSGKAFPYQFYAGHIEFAGHASIEMDAPKKFAVKYWIAEAAVVVLALVAFRKDNHYSYYIFLRWAACPLFCWIAWKAYSNCGMALAVAAGVMAVIYNPLLRVTMSRSTWEIVNLVMIVIAVWSAVLCVTRGSKEA